MELKESTCLTSDYTTKLQTTRKYNTGRRQEYRSMEQNRNSRDKSMHLWTHYDYKEARIYNGEKTIFLTSGAGKTGQPLVKE